MLPLLRNCCRNINRSMAVKRLFDICVSLAGIAILAPVFVVCGVLIVLDSPGGMLFVQKRVGQHQKPFRIFKLRTMRKAESSLLVTAASNPRITRVGRILRKYKLDEIPQLFNVLLGDMSLVGPRPEVAKYVAYYPPQAAETIFALRPGITDFASIHFADEERMLAKSDDPEQVYIRRILPYKLKYCCIYAKNRTLLLDMQILANTLLAVIK